MIWCPTIFSRGPCHAIRTAVAPHRVLSQALNSSAGDIASESNNAGAGTNGSTAKFQRIVNAKCGICGGMSAPSNNGVVANATDRAERYFVLNDCAAFSRITRWRAGRANHCFFCLSAPGAITLTSAAGAPGNVVDEKTTLFGHLSSVFADK